MTRMLRFVALAAFSLLLAAGADPARAQVNASPFFGIQLQAPDTSPLFQLRAGFVRLWGQKLNNGATSTWWPNNETSRGVFAWGPMATIVNQALARGQTRFLATIGGYSPGWSNNYAGTGNTGTAPTVSAPIPPTNLQDIYDYLTAYVTEILTLCSNAGVACTLDVGECDECNTANYFNTGTTGSPASDLVPGTVMSAMVPGMAAAIRAAAKAFPSATVNVAAPSVTSNATFSWLAAFLSTPALVGSVDEITDHPYEIPTFYGADPNQMDLITKEIQAIEAGAGVSKPLIWSEAGYATAITDQPSQNGWASLFFPIAKCDGVLAGSWYSPDSPLGSGDYGRLWNGSTGANNLNEAGVAMQTVQGWLAGATCSGPVARIAGTNGVRNPTFAGLVAPSTAPTDMQASSGDSGLTIKWAACGTDGGITCADTVFTGTPAATNYSHIYFETTSGYPAANGTVQNLTVCVRTPAGQTIPAGMTLFLSGDIYSGPTPGYLGQLAQLPIFPGPGATLDKQCYSLNTTVANASAYFVRPWLGVRTTAATSVGTTTLEIGAPSIDTGGVHKVTLTKASGYKADMVWDNSGTGPSYALPTGATDIRDVFGNKAAPGASDAITLTNTPQLIEYGPYGAR
jgi:hypothetical protein